MRGRTVSGSERIRGQFRVRESNVLPEPVHVTVLVLRNSFEVIPRVLAGSVACPEPPDLSTVGSGLPGDLFQMGEEQARRSDRSCPTDCATTSARVAWRPTATSRGRFRLLCG